GGVHAGLGPPQRLRQRRACSWPLPSGSRGQGPPGGPRQAWAGANRFGGSMFKIQTLNNISVKGLERLPRDRYEIASEIGHPDAVLVRSAKMIDMPIPDTVKAIGRAGAGVNNIPVEAMTRRGVVVFNAPVANANAVKELVLAGMLLAARNIPQAWDFARRQEGDDAAIDKAVEAGKKNFVGFELPGRTLGVIG